MFSIRPLASRLLVLMLAVAPLQIAWSGTIAYNSVRLDWSGLTFIGVDTGSGVPSLVWEDGTEYSLVSASNATDFDLANSDDWTTSIAAAVTNAVGQAESLADDQEMFAYTYADNQGAQFALGTREGRFSVQGSGTVEFSIPFEWDAEVVNDPPSTFFNIDSGLYALFELYSDFGVSSDWISVGLGSVDFLSGDGLLKVSLPFADGDTGLLYAEIYSESSIPLPGTVPLVLAAAGAWRLQALVTGRSRRRMPLPSAPWANG